jgi:hypothetical protein
MMIPRLSSFLLPALMKVTHRLHPQRYGLRATDSPSQIQVANSIQRLIYGYSEQV